MTIKKQKEKQLKRVNDIFFTHDKQTKINMQRLVNSIQNELIEAVCDNIAESVNIKGFEKIFREFYDDNESGGSSRWLVAPTNAQIITKGYFNSILDKIKEIKG
ncbi:hypothetical protein D4R42_00180 [bacterium]|nr:MAG: hypothetical protein D4R42_00180 [bacterium]